MKLKVTLRRLTLLGLITASTLAVGCAIQDPQALKDLHRANQALATAKQKGAADRFPDEYATLEHRYLEARGIFYACNEDKASNLAEAIINDANALADKRIAAPAAAPAPSNNPPMARFRGPVEGRVNQLLAFYGDESSDPDGDKLTYQWKYGDGRGATFRFPVATHRYNKVGSYTINLTVDDGRGGTDSTSAVVLVSSMQVIQGDVLFDIDKSIIKAKGREVLDRIISHLKENTSYRVHLVGHTDSTGTDAYNMGLSKRRAAVVQQYFITHGIAAKRVTADWKGESEPVAPNNTSAGRAKNRRTDITIKPAEE